MKKVLGIFCHPDDEILFGWPIFQSDQYEKYLIICCDDVIRKGKERIKALQEVCQQENIQLIDPLNLDNNFYTLPTRRATFLLTDAVAKIREAIEEAIIMIQPDYIFTHNPVGEYGHGSHRLLFEIVSQHPKVNKVIFTDICQESNHRSSKQIPYSVRTAYYREQFSKDVELLNLNFYNRTKAIYDKYSAWTWDFPPVKTSLLYYLRNYNG